MSEQEYTLLLKKAIDELIESTNNMENDPRIITLMEEYNNTKDEQQLKEII